jgi:hypothetical protein
MLGTHAVKQYFASGTTHYVTPLVSAEWNYNLFYQPLTTFAGDGTNKSTYTSWTWTNAPTTDTVNTKNGGTALKFGSVDSVGHGTSKSTVNLGSSLQNTYKIVFYAKVLENVEVNLTALGYIDYHRSGSVSKVIDNTQWVKFEMFVSSRPLDTSYSSFDFTLDYTSTDNTSSSYHILIDMLQIYQTTEFDYQYGELWPTKSPFSFFRPGESYVGSGNSLTPLPSNFRLITTPLNSDAHTTWNKQMPCSPVVYHPRLLGMGASNPLYKNGLLSDYSEYKYFVSDTITGYLGAIYEKQLPTNKIVLKFNLSYSTPTVNVRLYNTSTSYDSGNISVTPSASGTAVLYRQSNGTWSTTSWSTMPTFNLNGQITNSQNIDKIVINQTSSQLNSNYSTSSSVAKADMNKMQVIEISPRLELDLTYFTMNVDSSFELDNKQNPLPISAISANTATIQLSNVPLKVSGGLLSIFSNNSTSSPLKGLFKKNVKFYVNYVVRDQVSVSTPSDLVIPGGVFYADTWEGQDIERTLVSCYDISYQLQLRSPSDYVSQSQDIFTAITNILDFAGFTDYDYDTLKAVTTSSKQPIHSTYFFADGKEQKVFDVLRELLEVYQIGASVNAYGIMQFLSLSSILDNKTPNFILHDSTNAISMTDPTDNQSLSVSPNIVTDTYTETVKVKLGKAILKYKTPNMIKSLSADGTSGAFSEIETRIIQKSDALWTLEKDEMTTSNMLAESIDTVSQNYLKINPLDFVDTFTSFDVDHDGYAIIEDEIISFRDKEFIFSTKPLAKTDNSLIFPKAQIGDFVRTVSSQSDLKSAITEFSEFSGYGGEIVYRPTGYIRNIQRGLFNTPVRTHKVINNDSDLATKIVVHSGTTSPVVNLNKVYLQSSGVASRLKPIDQSNTSSTNYNTFSVKMDIGVNSKEVYYDSSDSGMFLADSAIKISITTFKGTGTTKYYYLYASDNSGTMIEGGEAGIDITGIIENEGKLYPLGSPFEENGQIVNLKFVKTSSSTFEIYVNKNKINVKPRSSLTLNLTGDFGMYYFIHNGSGSVAFTELYATQTALADESTYYHYELPTFSNAIVGNHKVFEMSYMFQTKPRIVGITKYDIKYSAAPSITAYPLKVAYNWYYFEKTASNAPTIKYISVNENDLNYSNIHHSGFRGRVFIVNSSPSSVWLKKSPDAKNTVDVIFSINTDNLISLSEEQIIEKVFDETNTAESVEISSNWVQSKQAANGILNTIFRAVDGFSRDTQISIYGNPLIEVGDVVKINYSLKNISEQIYFVQAVKHSFDSGLKTVLTLNQIA